MRCRDGAGKSTTLGALVGLYRMADGAILYRNRSLIGRDTAEIVEDGIALVPEGNLLFPDMTVRENLQMGAYGRGRRQMVAEGLERCFALFPVLREKAGQPAGQLSGGQQQMVAIGRALMMRPRLLLLDEPFLGVAPIIIDEVMVALARLSHDGVTLLPVEQNIRRAMDFVARAYVIENGRTVLNGSRDTLLGRSEFQQQVSWVGMIAKSRSRGPRRKFDQHSEAECVISRHQVNSRRPCRSVAGSFQTSSYKSAHKLSNSSLPVL